MGKVINTNNFNFQVIEHPKSFYVKNDISMLITNFQGNKHDPIAGMPRTEPVKPVIS